MTGSSLPSRRRLIQLGAGFAVLLAGAVSLGWRAGEAPSSNAAAPATAPWALPQVRTQDPARDVATLTARRPWGGDTAFRDTESAPPAYSPDAVPWQLAGIIERGGERFALILVGPGPAAKLEYRTIGDSLPDGSVLVQIGADSATSDGGKSAAADRRVYRLFEKAR